MDTSSSSMCTPLIEVVPAKARRIKGRYRLSGGAIPTSSRPTPSSAPIINEKISNMKIRKQENDLPHNK